MAPYNPPQPMWKRNFAGILDFLLAFIVCVYVSAKIFGNFSGSPVSGDWVVYFGVNNADYKVGGVSALFAAGLMIAYFVILGGTGGTVFQRLLGMKRVACCRKQNAVTQCA